MDAFRQALHQPGDADLVDHLRKLAASCRPHQPDHARIGVDPRPRFLEDLRLAAAHDGQHAVFGAGLAAGDRRIDETAATGAGGGVEFAGNFGAGRGVVDQDGAWLHSGKDAVGAGGDLAQVVVVADAGEDEIGVARRLRRRRRRCAAIDLGPAFRFGGGAVIDRHGMAALVPQVSRHRKTHHAEADERHICHWSCSS